MTEIKQDQSKTIDALPTGKSDKWDEIYRGRQIPWLKVVRFHKEIVTRAEEGFFSLNGRDDQAERWSSLTGFVPDGLEGPWIVEKNSIRSKPFRLSLEQVKDESLFLGGPCYLGWTKKSKTDWLPQWRPLLYREVSLKTNGDFIEIVPQQGRWNFSPLLYSIFQRMEVRVDTSLDEFASALIEMADGYRQTNHDSLENNIFKALFNKVPGFENEIDIGGRQDIFPVQPTPWVIFAPTSSFSVLTRHLIQDYNRLESLLMADETNIGGLRLMEDQPVRSTKKEIDILPIVRLNPSQQRAVCQILEHQPLTVISGPPGTGKSQVVVSLLLNAWASGQTVLFASNNNKAVDVVRDRLERFESEFPIAVRAGAKQKQNIQEVLRRTLNMAAIFKKKGEKTITSQQLREKRKILVHEQLVLQDALNSKLPQRVDESKKAAIHSYGDYRQTLADLINLEKELTLEQSSLGFEGKSVFEIEQALRDTKHWLETITQYQDLIELERVQSCELQEQIKNLIRLRNNAVAEMGLVPETVEDWTWLLEEGYFNTISKWEQRLRDMLAEPVELSLKPIEWLDDYNLWGSSEEASLWAKQASAFSETIQREISELSPKISIIQKLSSKVDEAKKKINEIGLSENIAINLDVLDEWIACYSEYISHPQAKLDFLPWSKPIKIMRRLKELENKIRPALPLSILTKIGALDKTGQTRLAPIIDEIRNWIRIQNELESENSNIEEIESHFVNLRLQASSLRFFVIPNEQNPETWIQLARQYQDFSKVAEHAAFAWVKKEEKESIENGLKDLAKKWSYLGYSIPIFESWRCGLGKNFDEAINNLGEKPDGNAVITCRKLLYQGKLSRLLNSWMTAKKYEKSINDLQFQLRNIIAPEERIRAWWNQRPQQAFILKKENESVWPELEPPTIQINKVADWIARKKQFEEKIKPNYIQKAEKEWGWAIEKLNKAIEMLPDSLGKSVIITMFASIQSDLKREWPIPEINQAFFEFSPERIRSRIEQIDSELEKISFEYGKACWLDRLHKDDEAIRAVDSLEKSIRQYNGQVIESKYDIFKTALRAVPIWITTAQASQAIPLEPELFDIVVIDEASQCTLTNLLPLMYRGKSLAIIGDENQLPAIPTIQESEELALAKKYELEDYIQFIGHATTDVYNVATESLPRRRADVIMLNEHYRSHPQIIGFSNRYIYQQRLEIKQDPHHSAKLPIGSGIHKVPVMGLAQHGDNGRSWLNIPEAEAVLKILQEIKAADSRTLSIGIVTPFSAHKEYLREHLEELNLSAEVLVDTANGFQGDERDIIIFSPVVAKGITDSASRWVESPPNLINVAITRAREALFVVCDFDYCLMQSGVLRHLALYCKDIQLLRNTSPAELELFSWMVAKGWEPRVHPCIGDIETDFVLESKDGRRLAIEVDGQQHNATIEQDKARDAYLMGQNYDVLRLPAREVLETPFEVIHKIETKLY